MAKIITENFKVETTNELFNSFKNQNGLLGAQFETELTTLNNGTLSNVLSVSNISEITTLVSNQLQSLRPEAEYYIMASRALSSVENVPSIKNTQKDKRDFQRKVIFGNKVDNDSARYMFYENTWIPGTIYDAYDDTKDIESSNTIISIRNADDDYLIFKCIENNNNSPSTSSPQAVIAELASSGYQSVETSDKYIWHYMFTVVASEANIYKTSNSLPLPSYGGDRNVIANAKECISQIIVESTPTNHFNQFVFDLGSNSSFVSRIDQRETVVGTGIREIDLRIANNQVISNISGFYKNMYLRASEGPLAGKLFEVLDSESDQGTSRITVFVNSYNDLPAKCELVPKVLVSNPSLGGTTAKAYGIVNTFGTLTRVAYETKGTNYKFATASAINPTGLSDDSPTTLRAVVSPSGGHGSNPANELAMSRLCIVTNFSGESATIPSTNYYTQVGLVKNPKFETRTGTGPYATSDVPPASFDNRTSFIVSDDQRSQITQGNFIEQFVESVSVTQKIPGNKYVITELGNLNTSEWQSMMGVNLSTDVVNGNVQPGVVFTANSSNVDNSKTGVISTVVSGLDLDKDIEAVKGTVHEVVYDSSTNTTRIYVVDNSSDHRSNFLPGKIIVKNSAEAQSGNTLTINNFSEIVYGSYVPYSGDLLHYIDFSPIERKEITKEKIKFLFDF